MALNAIALITLCAFSQSFAQEAPTLETLDDYIAYAVEHNPLLKAYADLYDAKRHVPSQARALPDPMVTYGYFAENTETRLGPQEHLFMVQQKIPFFGKRSLRGQIAEQDAWIAGKTYDEKKHLLIENLKQAYYEYYLVYSLIRVTEEERVLIEQMQETAQVRYASGEAAQQDVLKAQLSLARVDDELTRLERASVSAVTKINRLLHRETGTEPAIPRVDFSDVTLKDVEQYIQLAKSNRPELEAARIAEEKAAKARALAGRMYFPDLTLGMQYVIVGERDIANLADNGKDALLFTASINLPIWFRGTRAGVKEAEARIAQAGHEREADAMQIRQEVRDAHAGVKEALERVALYRDVMIPQAEQTFRAGEAGYQTGKVDFLDYLDGERMFLSIRKMYYEAMAELGTSLAHLERVAGGSLTPGEQ
jgi:cobalt-zinc-cadmium efflux system outer membrane protein